MCNRLRQSSQFSKAMIHKPFGLQKVAGWIASQRQFGYDRNIEVTCLKQQRLQTQSITGEVTNTRIELN